MDLQFSDEAIQFRDELRAWLKDNLPRPYIEEVRNSDASEDSLVEVRRNFQKKLNDAGYIGMGWPTEWGGRGATDVEEAILHAELAAADAPLSPNNLGLSLCAPALIHHGTEEQRQRFIPPMVSCDEIWCQGFSEPGAGSDLAGIRTRAVPDGDDFRITGQKVWTTLGPWSDWIFVLARTDMEDRHGGISFFLMPIDQPGVEMRSLKQITGESEFGEVFFDNALAKREHVVGKLQVSKVGNEAALLNETGAIEVALHKEYPRRDFGLKPEPSGRLLDCGRDLEGFASDPKPIANLEVELQEQRRIHEDATALLPELAPKIRGLRPDLSVEGIDAVDREQIDQPTAARAFGQRHRSESRDVGGPEQRLGFERFEGRFNLRSEEIAALQSQIRTEQFLRSQIHRVIHGFPQ